MGNRPSRHNCYVQKHSIIHPAQSHIIFLSEREARSALKQAELIDDFQGQIDMYPINRLARRSLSYRPVNLDTTPTIELPELTFDVRICWLHTTAESGMPHTRPPNLICIPAYISQYNLAETVRHEAIHVDQRLNPSKWVQWCVRNGWALVPTERIPERWLNRCRLNPDTMQYRFWAYQNRWVPLPMFERVDVPELRLIFVKWWDMKTGDLLLRPPNELAQWTTGVANPEHPFEIAAYKNLWVASSKEKFAPEE